jgi:hypothetical protein
LPNLRHSERQLWQVILSLAFLQANAQNGSGYQPCLWRKPEVGPASS